MAPRRGWHVDRVTSGKPGVTGGIVDTALVPLLFGDEQEGATDNYLAGLSVAGRFIEDPVVARHVMEILGLPESMSRDNRGRLMRPQRGRCRGCRRLLYMRANGYMAPHTGPDEARCEGSHQLPVLTQPCAYVNCKNRFETGSRPRKYCSAPCREAAGRIRKRGVAA